MKKFIILALVSVLSIGANAQKITWDKTKDGLRYIGTDSQICRNFKDKVVLSASLSVSKRGDITIFHFVPELTFSTQCSAPKNGKMLIKLFDDSVIELTTALGDEQMVRKVHNINGLVYSDYTMQPIYDVSEEQLTSIIEKGVKEIRIETSPIVYENEYKKDKIGKVLADRYSLLKDALKKNPSFSDGF